LIQKQHHLRHPQLKHTRLLVTWDFPCPCTAHPILLHLAVPLPVSLQHLFCLAPLPASSGGPVQPRCCTKLAVALALLLSMNMHAGSLKRRHIEIIASGAASCWRCSIAHVLAAFIADLLNAHTFSPVLLYLSSYATPADLKEKKSRSYDLCPCRSHTHTPISCCCPRSLHRHNFEEVHCLWTCGTPTLSLRFFFTFPPTPLLLI
jgi:hypothetical protein